MGGRSTLNLVDPLQEQSETLLLDIVCQLDIDCCQPNARHDAANHSDLEVMM